MEEYYHLFNRGVEKRTTFLDDRDYLRFLEIVEYYLNPTPPISFSQRDRLYHEPDIQHRVLDIRFENLIDVVAYCLMPNHFHFLVRVNIEGGLETWIRRVANSYTRSFNVRYDRVGPLFQGPYKLVHVTTNEQLLHVSRYMHLNPVVAKLTTAPAAWRWSSMKVYLGEEQPGWLKPEIITQQFRSPPGYRSFVEDYVGYALELATIKKLLIDGEE
jgi:putative transposase